MKYRFALPAVACLCAVSGYMVYRTEVAASDIHSSLSASLEPIVGEELAATAAAPNVPPPLMRKHATKVVLNIEVKEHVKTLADGVTYTYWTFGDDAPGRFIRVREGDLVETHFSNHPDNMFSHNVDFHAASGPEGGGDASFIAPGHTATFSWRAMNPGLFIYHCVAAPAGLHISNGMYGLILVEPKGGLPGVDKEFFVVQGEFYTRGAYGERGQQEFSMEKALKEQPDYVVFNGHVGALMGDRALRVKAGQSVRMYLGNPGPSLVSSFHVVGGIFNNVYGEGGSTINQHNVQTTVIPVGGTATVEMTADVPGNYTIVDHAMFRAFNKGAMGLLVVDGAPRTELFSGRQSEETYSPGTHLQRVAATTGAVAIPAKPTGGANERGKQIYATICVGCHQPDGRGLANTFPPLAQSDFLMGDKDRVVRVLLQGRSGQITVNGRTFNNVMPKLPLTDEDIASALSYVRNSFGNTGSVISVADVARVRAELGGVQTLTNNRAGGT
jgi:nitrite reductase (NO-forming)